MLLWNYGYKVATIDATASSAISLFSKKELSDQLGSSVENNDCDHDQNIYSLYVLQCGYCAKCNTFYKNLHLIILSWTIQKMHFVDSAALHNKNWNQLSLSTQQYLISPFRNNFVLSMYNGQKLRKKSGWLLWNVLVVVPY